ncbi:MAG: MFS transporter [Firmicutes bacterium]|nr:MFS transporter [Bacillota bacterium]
MTLFQSRKLLHYNVFVVLTSMRFWAPILIVFLHQKGLNYKDIALLQIWGYWISLLFDLPTSILADYLGRKMFIFLYSILGGIGFFLYWYSNSFSAFLFAEAFISFGAAFGRGVTDSYFYEALKKYFPEQEHIKKKAFNSSLLYISLGLSALVGGFVADIWSMEFCFLLSGIGYLLSALVVLFSFEDSTFKRKFQLKDLQGHFRTATTVFKNNFIVRLCVEYFLFISITNVFLFTYLQPLLKSYHLENYALGIVYLLLNAFNYTVFTVLKTRISINGKYYNIICATSLLAIPLINQPIIAILLVFSCYFSFYMRTNGIFLEMNKLIADETRSTFSSLINLIAIVALSLHQFVFSLIMETYNIKAVLITMGVVLVFVFFGLQFIFRSKKGVDIHYETQ